MMTAAVALLALIAILMLGQLLLIHHCCGELYRLGQAASRVNDGQMAELIAELAILSGAASRLGR